MNKQIIGYGICLTILFAACAGDGVFPLPEGSPLKVVADIESASAHGTVTRATMENDYDRSTFKPGDRIRITRTRAGSASATVDYTYSVGAWTPAVTGSDILFESGATYQAVYPLDYSGVRTDQRTADNYRLSNRLETQPAVKASNTGVLSFTDSDCFKHKNVKLTLKFVGSVTLSGTSDFSVEGKGLYSGTDEQEYVYPFRADEATHDWHVIIAPKAGAADIKVTVTPSNGVSYTCTVSCSRVAGTNYIYTLTIRNDILVPVGEEIAPWNNESVYDGDLT